MFIYYVTLKKTHEEVMAFGHSLNDALAREGLSFEDIEDSWYEDYMD